MRQLPKLSWTWKKCCWILIWRFQSCALMQHTIWRVRSRRHGDTSRNWSFWFHRKHFAASARWRRWCEHFTERHQNISFHENQLAKDARSELRWNYKQFHSELNILSWTFFRKSSTSSRWKWNLMLVAWEFTSTTFSTATKFFRPRSQCSWTKTAKKSSTSYRVTWRMVWAIYSREFGIRSSTKCQSNTGWFKNYFNFVKFSL